MSWLKLIFTGFVGYFIVSSYLDYREKQLMHEQIRKVMSDAVKRKEEHKEREAMDKIL